jgi:RNA polymerase sigma-70 factor (ECF subfamily)
MTTFAMIEEHRVALTGHCYRMLGSVLDADDAVQDTMFRAWKAIDRFDRRSSLRTWLYRIATNVCLDALKDRPRRARPLEGPLGTTEDLLVEKPREHWLEPIPDAMAIPSDSDPSEEAILRESIRLAFVHALQHLPPKQRAVLILTQVLGWSAAEVAEGLDSTVASVNSALQRARETLARRNIELGGRAPALSHEQADLVSRYVDAFERYDIDALTKLLHEDATMSMPPYDLWLQGHAAIAGWLAGRGAGCRGSRLVPTAANGWPAFGQYRDGGRTPWGLVVLELRDGRVSGLNTYLDTAHLFPKFGLPMSVA